MPKRKLYIDEDEEANAVSSDKKRRRLILQLESNLTEQMISPSKATDGPTSRSGRKIRSTQAPVIEQESYKSLRTSTTPNKRKVRKKFSILPIRFGFQNDAKMNTLINRSKNGKNNRNFQEVECTTAPIHSDKTEIIDLSDDSNTFEKYGSDHNTMANSEPFCDIEFKLTTHTIYKLPQINFLDDNDGDIISIASSSDVIGFNSLNDFDVKNEDKLNGQSVSSERPMTNAMEIKNDIKWPKVQLKKCSSDDMNADSTNGLNSRCQSPVLSIKFDRNSLSDANSRCASPALLINEVKDSGNGSNSRSTSPILSFNDAVNNNIETLSSRFGSTDVLSCRCVSPVLIRDRSTVTTTTTSGSIANSSGISIDTNLSTVTNEIDNREYNIGDIVWAQMGSYPFW